MKRLFLILAVLLALALTLFHGDNLHPVLPGQIYRSAQLDETALTTIVEQQDIRSVVNLRGSNPGKDWYDTETATSRRLGVDHYDVRLGSDRLPPYTEIHRLLNVLDNAARPMLVHCQHGADRSGLASALSLLLYTDTGPDLAAWQYSPRFRVLRTSTTGRRFFQQYGRWLDNNKLQHSPTDLRRWIDHDYVDDNGNLSFYVDHVNGETWQSGTRFEDGYWFQLGDATELRISGWAVDRKSPGPVRAVQLLLGDRPLPASDYGEPYPGVAKLFGDDVYLNSGWRMRADIDDWPKGCYELTLSVSRIDGSVWRSPPKAGICLNQPPP